jgi:hypothetical protein
MIFATWDKSVFVVHLAYAGAFVVLYMPEPRSEILNDQLM